MNYSIHFVFLILCSKCIAVNIKRMEVPPLVELGTESVILDCDYSTGVKLGPGLVIKWFFNGSTGLVYQWIPPRHPQVIGLLKGKVDMTFKISEYDEVGITLCSVHMIEPKGAFIMRNNSEEPLQAHRAIKVISPSTHLSGNYTCVVSTFIEEDRQTRSMLIYSPGKNFHFIQEKNYVFLVTLICAAEDLYPRPQLTILSKGKPLEQAITDMRMDSWGMYSVETRAEVHDDDVEHPFEEFVCMLSLPLANYTATRTTIYYPGFMPTAFIDAMEVEKPQEHQANSCPVRTCVASLILIISFNLII